ncbi:tellurite resistance TerB family protein [Fortiea contorta]|uniref:tellurite resistance TerB family protein n=1 Tax=Fortiea contorta TaxID=1892405 RepID=UPI00034AD895|nr:tellurite resistance TerB family protein [Fortiea contorta]
MSLLDTVLCTENKTQVKLSPAEAVAAITLAVTAADGYPSKDEANWIFSTLYQMKLFRSYPKELMDRLFENILSILQRDEMNSLFNAAKESLSQELREAAFAVTTDILLAEGTVSEEEKTFLDDLHQALGISSEIAVQIVQVILIKNRG